MLGWFGGRGRAFGPRGFGAAGDGCSGQSTRFIAGVGAGRHRPVDMFPFDRASEAFDESVVGGAAPAVAADAAAGGQQGLFVGEAGELAALVGVEEVRGRGHAQRVGQGLQAKADVERVGELPAEHVARVPVEHGGQIQKALGHGHVRDIGAPHLVGGRGRAVAQQVGIARDALARHTQAGFGVDRLVAHQAHEAAHALLVDDVAGQAQVVAQAEYPFKVMVGELLVQ